MDDPSLSENDFARLDYYFANTAHVSDISRYADGRSSPDSFGESQSSSHQSLNGSYDIELIGEEGKIDLQKKYKIPKPRILRNDFRRFYPNMWVNVFNSCDSTLMMKHLNTFYSPNVGVVQADMRYDRMVHPLEIPMYQEQALGLGYLGKFWYAGMNIAPDLVCSLRHTMLKVRSDGTSAIKCAFILKGTMVSNLNDGKKEDVEKIARYQKLRDSGRTDIRDITFTEAAMVAVAPPTIVAVPGGRAEMLSNTSPLHSSKKNNVSTSTLASGEVSMSSPRESEPLSSADTIVKQEPGTAHTNAHTNVHTNAHTKTYMQLSCDSMDSAMSEDNRSTSSASMLSTGSAASPSVSASLLAASRKRRTRPTATGKPDATNEAKKSTLLMLSLENTAGSTVGQNSSRSPKATPDVTALEAAASNKYQHQQHQQQQLNWLSLAESAYGAGVLQPCQPHSAKEYYHAEEAPLPSAADMLHDHLSRSQSRSDEPGDSSAMDVVEDVEVDAGEAEGVVDVVTEPPPKLESTSADSEGSGVISVPTGKKIVLTAKIDCICSLELELDKDSVIVGVAVNYFR